MPLAVRRPLDMAEPGDRIVQEAPGHPGALCGRDRRRRGAGAGEAREDGEIETAHTGYLGSQDTFYVGTIKGAGRIYQQTFVDMYSK